MSTTPPDRPWTRDRITRFRLALVHAFEAPAVARVIASDAGIDTTHVLHEGTPELVWADILREAEHNNQLGELLRTALQQAPRNPALRSLLSEEDAGAAQAEVVAPVSRPDAARPEVVALVKVGEVNKMHRELRDAGVADHLAVIREALPNDLRAFLPEGSTPNAQMLGTLHKLRRQPRRPDGSTPLGDWLGTALEHADRDCPFVNEVLDRIRP